MSHLAQLVRASLSFALRWGVVTFVAVQTAACASLLESYPGVVMPWEQLPENFHWVVSFGPTINIFNEDPPGAENVFFGIRIGLHLSTAGEHHFSEAKAEDTWLAWWASLTYFRFGFPFLPDHVFVSPLKDATGMSVYGSSLRVTSIGTHQVGNMVRGALSAGLIVTYLYLETPGAPSVQTHFLRPGYDLRADLELDWGGSWFITTGWSSLFHLPQGLGTSFADHNPGGARLWHLGQAFLVLNIRLTNDGAPGTGWRGKKE